MRTIAASVAERHRLPIAALYGERRTAAYSLARDEAWAEIHATGKFSTPQIGRHFNRDHSSVVVGIQRHKERGAA
jgi:chromosomal replication initiation ATPase DnaA